MSLFVTSLNSGSNGNCYYVWNMEEAVLVDGGISCRETEKRLKRLGLSIKKVKAIFVTHEHGDHIHGVPGISKKHHIPVYITPKTLQNSRIEIKEELIFHFKAYETIKIGSLSITALPKFHDAHDPHSFIVASETVKVGVFTDTGRTCEHLVKHFSQCHAAFLESNYDEQMLESGGYPYALKNRIRGGLGHLSNKQALQLFRQHRPSFMSHLFLSHLSRENNSPELVRKLFLEEADRTEIIIATRHKETRVYHIRNGQSYTRKPMRSRSSASIMQLSLFTSSTITSSVSSSSADASSTLQSL